MNNSNFRIRTGVFLLLAATGCFLTGTSAQAQQQDGGYQVDGSQRTAPPTNPDPQPDSVTRFARFSYIAGNVTWRPSDSAAWKHASMNQSLHPGAQVWVTDGGRAEISFDDGSQVRIGNDTTLTVQDLYGDGEGEFTKLRMLSGLVTIRAKSERSIFKLETATNTIQTNGPSRVRIGLSDVTEVAISRGKATIEGNQGKTTLHGGDYVSLKSPESPIDVHGLPAEDGWERWNDARDQGKDLETRRYGHPSPPIFSSLFLSFGFGHRGYHRW